MDIPTHMAELDALRVARGMSYQTVADACGYSKATIYRAMTNATEPTAQVVQRIEAAIQYAPVAEPIIPADCSQEAYNDYLRTALRQQHADYNRHILQLQTHYALLHRQDRRTILLLSIGIVVLIAFLVAWLVYDVLYPTVGWFQR